MSSLKTEKVTEALMSGIDIAYEYPVGVTNPALYAMMANAHFKKYGSRWEQLAAIAIKNHHNASLNPKAQYPSEVLDPCASLMLLSASPHAALTSEARMLAASSGSTPTMRISG